MSQNKIKSKMRFTKHKCNVDDPYSPYCLEVSVEDVINSYLERLADDLASGPFIDVELSREMQDNEQEILFRCTNSDGTERFSKLVIDMQPTTENQVEYCEIDLAESLVNMAAAFFEQNDIPTFTCGVDPRVSIKLLRDLVDQNEVNNASIEEFREFLHKHKRTILKMYSDNFEVCRGTELLLAQPAILIIFMLSSYGRRCHEFTDISENEMSDLNTTWDVAQYCSKTK